jgi:hypothetical protein
MQQLQAQAQAACCAIRQGYLPIPQGREGPSGAPRASRPHLPRLKGKTRPSASAPATSTNTADRLLKCRQQATSTARAAKRKASGPLPGTLHSQARQVRGGGGRKCVFPVPLRLVQAKSRDACS